MKLINGKHITFNVSLPFICITCSNLILYRNYRKSSEAHCCQ